MVSARVVTADLELRARLIVAGTSAFTAAQVNGPLAKGTAFVTGLFRPLTTVLGNEFAGVVEAVGGSVTSFTVGDRVFGYSGDRFGAHAEYMSIPEGGPLTTMPLNVTYEEAAASTEGSHHTLSLIRAAPHRTGDATPPPDLGCHPPARRHRSAGVP